MRKIFLALAAFAGLSLTACTQEKFQTASVSEFAKLLASDTVQLVDVRTEDEFSQGHIRKAMNIDVRDTAFLSVAKETLKPEITVAVYCRSGHRSAKAAGILAAGGYKVVNLDGGILAWEGQMGSEELEKSDKSGYIVFDGDVAPQFTAKLADGRQFSLAETRGKVVMLQFTASWCGVCRKEMPHIESEIWQKHKADPQNFVLIGVDRDEPLETVKRFAKQTGITYPLALDPGAKIYEKYAVRESGITRNVLIGRDGRIIKRTRLYDEAEFASLVSAIDSALQEP